MLMNDELRAAMFKMPVMAVHSIDGRLRLAHAGRVGRRLGNRRLNLVIGTLRTVKWESAPVVFLSPEKVSNADFNKIDPSAATRARFLCVTQDRGVGVRI